MSIDVDACEGMIKPLPALSPDERDAWNCIVRQHGLNVTLAPDWTSIVARTVGRAMESVEVFVDRDPVGRVRAIVPFVRTTRRKAGWRVRTVQPVSSLMSYHAEIVAAEDGAAVIGRWLSAAYPWDMCLLTGVMQSVKVEAASAAVRNGWHCTVAESESSPFLPIEGTWSELLGRKGKKFRYKVRKRRELLDVPGWSVVWLNDAESAGQALDVIVRIDARSWKAEHGRDIGSRRHELDYHRLLIPYLAQAGSLRCCVLYCGSMPIAYNLCVVESGWMGQMKTSFDEAYASHSPGGLVIDVMLERAFNEGIREFDFLGDKDEHKLGWTGCVRQHFNVSLFSRSLTGQVLGWLKRRV